MPSANSERGAFAAAVREVIELRDVRAALIASGHTPFVIDSDGISRGILTARQRWGQLIKDTGYKIDS